MDGYVTLITEESLADEFRNDLRRAAIEDGMEFYILKEKGCSLPGYMNRARIGKVEEFEGPVGSDSYALAEKRLLNYLGVDQESVSFQAKIELPVSLS